jgi:hypothetical protein
MGDFQKGRFLAEKSISLACSSNFRLNFDGLPVGIAEANIVAQRSLEPGHHDRQE